MPKACAPRYCRRSLNLAVLVSDSGRNLNCQQIISFVSSMWRHRMPRSGYYAAWPLIQAV